MPKVLNGIRVLDLTHVLAGPFAGYQLAVLGAEVIKVESPHEPDQARFQGSDRSLNDAGMGTAFLSQAANKKALSLDLKSEAGRDVLKRLVVTADVLIENYRPGALDALGLGYAELKNINPCLIYCSISAFGTTGPKRELTAYDGVIQAFSGMMAMTGFPGTDPVKCGAPVVDYATGTTAALAIMAALFQRMGSGGEGQFVEVAMLDVAMILSSSHLTSYLWNGSHPQQKGNSYPFATIGCYEATDAHIMISASNMRQQRRLWEVLDRADLVKHSNSERLDAFQAERDVLAAIIRTQSADHWEALFRGHGIPISRVQRMGEMLDDEQVQSRKVLHRFSEEPGALKGLVVPVSAFQLSSSPTAIDRVPQTVGAQDEELLLELGYGEQDILDMRAAGVICQ